MSSHTHICANCGQKFTNKRGDVVYVKRPKGRLPMWFCSEECKLGINYSFLANGALTAARHHQHEYLKQMRNSFQWQWIDDEGHFCYLEGVQQFAESAESEYNMMLEALNKFRELTFCIIKI